MTSKILADRLREVLLRGKWIAGTNYKELIQDLSWEQAVYRVENFNTVALLVYHINYYLEGLIQVLDGGPLEIRDTYSFDLAPIKNEADWQNLVQGFLTSAATFADKVEALDDDQLKAPFVDPKYGSYYRNIEGVIEHSYYHMGQIALLRKVIVSKDI